MRRTSYKNIEIEMILEHGLNDILDKEIEMVMAKLNWVDLVSMNYERQGLLDSASYNCSKEWEFLSPKIIL